jgi:hypothetical protein
LCLLFINATAFMRSFPHSSSASTIQLRMAEVDLVFPGNKKCKAASGTPLKDGKSLS